MDTKDLIDAKDSKTQKNSVQKLNAIFEDNISKNIDKSNLQYDDRYDEKPPITYNPSQVKHHTWEYEEPETEEQFQFWGAATDFLQCLNFILLCIILYFFIKWIVAFCYKPSGPSIIAEYIWIDGSGALRAKCRTLDCKPSYIENFPEWNYDGSSTYQATTENSEVILKPAFAFPDPFRGGDHVMVLCETYIWSDTTYTSLVPTNTNFRHFAKKIFDANKYEEPWFGIEQEYTILQSENRFQKHPFGWPKGGYPAKQGPYYCSVGGNVCFGRAIADAHYNTCIKAGIKISGTNSEVMPGQWEFQVGPCLGIEQGDHMFAARYLLMRCAEEQGLSISFEPKLFSDWNGSGCHTNFSTKTMRDGSKGMVYIHQMMQKFEAKHMTHMELYGQDNQKRLTGIHETSPYDRFSYGAGNRAASIRIPTSTMNQQGKGYIEDRRPASNIDPYVVSSIIFDTSVLTGSHAAPMIQHYKSWVNWLKTATIVKP